MNPSSPVICKMLQVIFLLKLSALHLDNVDLLLTLTCSQALGLLLIANCECTNILCKLTALPMTEACAILSCLDRMGARTR